MSDSNILRLWTEALRLNKAQLDLVSGDILSLRPLIDDTGAINIGDGTFDMDLKVFLGSTTEYVLFDVGNSQMTSTVPIQVPSLTGGSSTYAPFAPIAAQQTLAAGGGAVTITEYYTAGASDAGGDAWTLADATQVGHIKKIQLVTDGGGDATLTPTSLNGGTTITFADVGDYAILQWDGTGWTPIELGNDADGTSAPALA
jgi:hypothetical protein